jgi:predicted DNA-binding protein
MSFKRKVVTTAFLDPEDYEKLTDLSREESTSVSALIREAVKEFLEKKLKPVEEAKT